MKLLPPPDAMKQQAPDSPDLTGLGRYHLWILGGAFLCSIVLVFFVEQWAGYDFRKVVTAIMWALACVVSGIAVGFLFAIPRVDQEAKRRENENPDNSVEAPVDTSHYSQRVNTNLEEISDWLTKIIVGLGLVELRQIPDHLSSMAAVLAECFGEQCSHGFAGALIVWFAVLGFLIGYLTTRIYLSYVFSIADQMARKKLEQKMEKRFEQRMDSLIDKKIVQTEPLLQVRAETFSAIVEGLAAVQLTVTDPAIWMPAIAKLERVVATDATDARAAVVLGRLYRWKRNDLVKAIEVLTRNADKMKESGLPIANYANVLYNRACYNILIAKDLPEPARSQSLLQQRNVKEDLEAALDNSESLVVLSRTDTDLDSVRGEPWFQALSAKYAAVISTAAPLPAPPPPAAPPPAAPLPATNPLPERPAEPSDTGATPPPP